MFRCWSPFARAWQLSLILVILVTALVYGNHEDTKITKVVVIGRIMASFVCFVFFVASWFLLTSKNHRAKRASES